MQSLKLWQTLNFPSNWETWLNTYGNDGTLLDTDDTVSFINKWDKKAIKINYQPNDRFKFEYWLSEFDSDDNKISVLNVIFNDFDKAKNELPKILSQFLV